MAAEFRDGSREGDQAPPTPNDRPIVQELVIQDIKDRLDLGVRRYGTGLQAFNGRDMLKDAYDEVLDLATYLRGLREEVAELRETNQRLVQGIRSLVEADTRPFGYYDDFTSVHEWWQKTLSALLVGEEAHRPVERLADLETGDQV